MNIIADVIAVLLMLFGAWRGYKKGATRSAVQLIGGLAIIIVAYQFKDKLADLLIRFLPFVNFGGKLDGLYGLNFIVFKVLAFIVAYILLYCFLNILLELSGLIDLLIKVTIVLDKPSKILGAIFGLVESICLVFILSFSLMNFGQSQKYIYNSTICKGIMERTPILNAVFRDGIVVAERIYITIEDDTMDQDSKNLEIVSTLFRYGIITGDQVNENVQNGKLHIENLVVAS